MDRGAEVIAVDEDGWTAIMMAALGGHLTCLQLLVDGGADLNATSKDGRTTIVWATDYYWRSPDLPAVPGRYRSGSDHGG